MNITKMKDGWQSGKIISLVAKLGCSSRIIANIMRCKCILGDNLSGAGVRVMRVIALAGAGVNDYICIDKKSFTVIRRRG